MHAIRALVSAALAATMLTSCGLPSRLSSEADPRAAGFTSDTDRAVVLIRYDDKKQLTAIANLGVDIWSVDPDRRQAKGSMTGAQYREAAKTGAHVERLRETMRSRFDKGYHTYEALSTELRAIAAKNPEICRLIDLGDSWEKTQGRADRDLLALRFGKGEGKPVVLFAGCHHAREIATPEMVLGMAHHLANGYGKDAEVTAAVDTREIWLVPMVNPDGHAHSAAGRNQRKNTNNVSGGRSRIGVDLNRNYATAWGTVGDSPNPESDTFRGKAPFSEPETRAMRDLMLSRKPVFLLTFHSFSNMVLWPWDHKDTPPPDPRLELVGKQLGKLSGYKAQQGSKLYLNGGDDVDWAFETLGTLSYTIEVGTWGDGFDPPYSKIPQFWNENRPMMLHTLKLADNPGAAAGPEVGRPVSANGMLSVPLSERAVAAEYFVGQPGAPGTGQTLGLNGLSARAALPRGPRQVVYVHARDAQGRWGPWSFGWSQ